MKKKSSTLLLLLSAASLFAQGQLQDYKNARSLWQRTQGKVFNSNVRANWIGEGAQFWYEVTTPIGKNFYKVDPRRKSKQLLFPNSQTLAQRIQNQSGQSVDALQLPFSNLSITPKGDTIRFDCNRLKWCYLPQRDLLIKGDSARSTQGEGRRWNRGGDRGYWGNFNPELSDRSVPSQDGKWEVVVRDYNLVLRNLETNTERQITTDGTPDHYYSSYIQWSPSSLHFAMMKIIPPKKHLLYLIESSPSDQVQPKLHTREYLKAGDTVAVYVPQIFEVSTGRQLQPETTLFPNAFSTHNIRWNKDGKAITFEYNQRGHQLYRVLEMSAENGTVRPLVEETSHTFVNYGRYFRHDLSNGRELIWMSERDNWNHLYMYDRATGKVKHQITKGEWYVRDIIDVNEEKKEITFTANGMEPGQDPYFIHYYRIKFDGSSLTRLTEGNGTHSVQFSPDKSVLFDTYSAVNAAPICVLRDTRTGKKLMDIEQADISQLSQIGWQAPEPFVAKGRDGKTDMWGVIVRPTNFDPSKRYPVIEYIYAGPGSHYVQKNFSTTMSDLSSLAELGFIVVQLDAMGTSFRSKAFEEIIYKNIADSGFPDRIAWIKAAAEKYPYMDISSVGIYGCSAGGQSALGALLHHPEFYKVGYAACGCHDNRMDKIWWNEQWMGEMGPHYAANSNVENAHKLQGKLMIMVGEMDDNVDPASTYQVVNALIKADKDFELLVMPGVGHSMGERWGEHKRWDFFVKHLLRVDPPAWNDLK